MRIVFLSDTHGQHEGVIVPDADVVCHTGDFVNDHTLYSSYSKFIEWFSSLNHKYKILIAGNHEVALDNEILFKQTILDLIKHHNIIYLENSEVIIEGVKFYGSPNTPMFYDWAFMRERGAPMQKIWKGIPSDVNVLLTHGPAFGIGDKTRKGELTGCMDLLNTVMKLTKLKYHCFGHIHESSGVYTARQLGLNTIFVNASIVNDSYKVVNKPRYFEL